MKEKDISISHVYASPSLRCVESACSLLQGNFFCLLHCNHLQNRKKFELLVNILQLLLVVSVNSCIHKTD